jgi:hypothetical protein
MSLRVVNSPRIASYSMRRTNPIGAAVISPNLGQVYYGQGRTNVAATINTAVPVGSAQGALFTTALSAQYCTWAVVRV